MSKVRYIIMIGGLLLALLLSALNTAPVLADESQPPAETTSEETADEVADPAPTEEEATPPSSGEPESAVEEESTPPSSGEPESTVEEESTPVEEILAELPEDTQLIVLDENGEAVSLASQQAEEAVVLGDPRWCPVGVTPGGAGCSPAFTRFVGTNANDGLLNWLQFNNPAKAGVIWIEAIYDSTTHEFITTTDIAIDGSSLTNMANYALTINGGWLATPSGTGGAISTTDFSEFHIPFSVIGWNAPVTINNISVNNVASGTYALEVGTAKGLITLNNVEVADNTVTQAGANLSNDLAVVPAGITVNNSSFTGNTANGLEILTKGAVNLKNITANGNDEFGASIDNTPAVTAQAVNLTGTNTFNYNGLDGLFIKSKGVITLNYITASYNDGGSGVYIDNCLQALPGAGLCTNTFASAVTIKGLNVFSYNGWDGLRVYSNGVITATNIIANNNGTDPLRDNDTNTDYDNYGKGVYLDNKGATVKRAVTVNGTNAFNYNISNGLFVVSNGLITISNVTANKNECDEINEGNSQYCAGVYLESYGGVTQTGYATFIDNLQDGLRITTYNTPVVLTTLYAADNGKDGIHIDGGVSVLPANITINGTNISNNNGQFGIWVTTNGAVTLTNITANYNLTSSGLYVDNTLATVARAVVLKGVNTFQGNGATGLTIFSRGAITTYSLNVTSNSGQGVFLDNCDFDVVFFCQAYTTLVNKVATTQAVSMLGTNYVNNNLNGVVVNSRGNITISNLTSIYNNNNGVQLVNDYENAVGNISFTGASNLSNNTVRGLDINTRGAVSIANMTANYNDSNGVFITNNINPLKPFNVTFTGTNRFNDNGETGLKILTNGAVVLYNITANGNGDGDEANGVFVDNATGTNVARAVILYGYNYFNDNTGTGLHVLSKGAITVQRITANNNQHASADAYGAYLNNSIPSGTQPVTVSGFGIFLNNSDSGLRIISSGTVTAASLTANNNVLHGVDIDTHYDPLAPVGAAVNVVISGVNNFNNNGVNGLNVLADGAITLSNIFASTNGENGAFVDNLSYAGSSLNKTIIFNGVNTFYGNGNNGLEFKANGAVTLNRLTSFGNTDGLNLNTGSGIVGAFSAGSSLKTLTFNCGSVMGNEQFGMEITGATAITLKGVSLGQPNLFSVTPVITRACPLP